MNRSRRFHRTFSFSRLLLLATAVWGLIATRPVQAAFGTYTDIADSTMYPPGQGTTFSQFNSIALSGSNVVFVGGSNGGYTAGIYTGNAGTTGVTRIVDTSMYPPGQSTVYSSTSSSVISGSNIAFVGGFNSGAGSGIYSGTVGVAGATRVADITSAAPGQSTKFSSFGAPALSGSNLAFVGSFNSYNGIGIYTGTAGTAGAARIVDNTMNAPGQSTVFTQFADTPVISGSNVAFSAYFNGGKSTGIYTGVAGTTGATRLADTSLIAPGQTTTYYQFYAPVISGSNVAFYAGSNTNQVQGIYTGTVGMAGASLLVDTTMTAPGQTTTFSQISNAPVISGSNVAFYAYFNAGRGSGIYLGTAGTAGVTRIADTSMTAPGQSTKFSSVGEVAVSGSEVAFLGRYNSGNSQSIYLYQNGNYLDVVDTGQALFGSTISALDFTPSSLDGNDLAFTYTLANGVKGVAIVAVPEPATWLAGALLAAAASPALRRRLRPL